ncbi:MAG: ATP-binding protein [Candidatus Woesearchaeota archaeon]|nr:ATP-binding protein [Candidatus Woesearchaeota archaeon]
MIEIIKEQRAQLFEKEHLTQRAAFAQLLDLYVLKHIIALIGVRRCGKSTLMKQLARHLLNNTPEENILYLNLENPHFNQHSNDITYLAELYNTFRQHANTKKQLYIFLDEIQFFTDWQVFVKDLYERENVKIIITGSNSHLLSGELATLLSGRMIPLYLYPYSFTEQKNKLPTYLERGGFPEVQSAKKNHVKLLAETYYKNILYQDVIPRFNIRHSKAIEELSYYLLSNIGKELSYSTLTNIADLNDKTVKLYISYLEDANLLYTITNYDPSLKKQLGNKKKVYAVDPLFVNFLGFNVSPNYGRLLEQAVYLELRRRGDDVYFFKNGIECDFVTKRMHTVTGCIQVTKTLHKNKERELRGLLVAMEKFKVKEGTIVTESTEMTLREQGKKIIVVPFEQWVQ